MEKIRESDRDVADNFRHIYIYIYMNFYLNKDRNTRSINEIFEGIIFRSSPSTISKNWWLIKIVFANVPYSIIIENVSVEFLNVYIFLMIFVRRIELSGLFINDICS